LNPVSTDWLGFHSLMSVPCHKMSQSQMDAQRRSC
jgi:hypothetical protein